ncbi:exonuclease VIII [Salmonella enterica subsp. enterica]|nr:exonuclease VIII [Salmonella enterica subsp. enterica]EHI6477905.1 exonuclease VIII [Salmonella enterica]EHC6701421.1 exonuclease VIII [Salmonella enterica subsp. enterica]EIK2672777.1 PD-(D/E)XK nuclease-like domain-containing protein [Salmonella enterica]EJB3450308.1 PD-(D/E)XK nuclease-like domain-containing protein [Salmonella enterica subsp. enterica]
MSENKEDFALHCPVKNEEARKRLGIKAGFFWTTAKKLSVAVSRCIAAMDDKGYDEDDFKKPVRVNFPFVNDLPPEGVFDTEFCNRYEKGGQDSITMVLIPGAVPADPFHGEAVEDTAVTSDTPVTAPGTDSDDTGSAPLPAYAYNVNGEPMEDVEKEMLQPVASMDERHRILSQFILEDKFSHRITPEQLSEVSSLELDMSNSYIQDMLLACHNVPGIQKLDNPNLWKFTDAFKKIFPQDKRHTLHMMMNFAQAYADAHPIDRALLAKEWQKGNRVSCINRTPSGANAGGSILTDRGEGFVHDRASLARDVATGVLARSMDVDIYNLHPAHAKRVGEIVADNKPPFDVFCKAFLNMPGGMDYSRAIVVASVKEAPTGIEAIPARVTEYLNRVLTETDHASPDPVIVDIACGRTSQPMPVKGSANDDEEKPQSTGELADEQTAPETVEQDTTEHHPDPQPLDAQSPVDPVEVAYQKKRAELEEARKNIPPKNPVDAGKQLAAARGEYVEGISDPDDPKWVHNDYSASNEGEKTEVATDSSVSAADTADYVDHSEDFSNQHEPETCHSEPAADQNEPEMPQTGPEVQSRVPDDIKPGIYFDITNEAYHAGPGVSKSQLDDIAVCPALYQWRKAAPVDTEKTKALDMGTALHCRLLEPDEFKKRFIIAPEFNRRTTAGKEEEKAFLENCANSGKTVMTAEEGRKLELMYGSVMAHPGCRALLEAEGKTESSIYWTDTETGELCRIRPDKFLANSPLILDVKKVADMSRFSRHVEEFRYHVQAAMYCEGWKAYSGETPKFSFLAVSESIDCGKYPVHLYILEDEHHDIGYSLFRRDLNTYHECKSSNKWGWGFEVIERPYWARG